MRLTLMPLGARSNERFVIDMLHDSLIFTQVLLILVKIISLIVIFIFTEQEFVWKELKASPI